LLNGNPTNGKGVATKVMQPRYKSTKYPYSTKMVHTLNCEDTEQYTRKFEEKFNITRRCATLSKQIKTFKYGKKISVKNIS